MATVTSQDYGDGNQLIAGVIQSEVVSLAADTYYAGMPLKYEVTPTAAYVGTGNGTCTLLSASSKVLPGAWTFTMTAALAGDLADPNGNIVASGLTLTDGGAAAFDIGGLAFTITDGATAFTATGVWTITVGTAGVYEYYSDFNTVDAFYNGTTKTLASAGYGTVIIGGAINEVGIVDGANSQITLTAASVGALAGQGFYVKKEA